MYLEDHDLDEIYYEDAPRSHQKDQGQGNGQANLQSYDQNARHYNNSYSSDNNGNVRRNSYIDSAPNKRPRGSDPLSGLINLRPQDAVLKRPIISFDESLLLGVEDCIGENVKPPGPALSASALLLHQASMNINYSVANSKNNDNSRNGIISVSSEPPSNYDSSLIPNPNKYYDSIIDSSRIRDNHIQQQHNTSSNFNTNTYNNDVTNRNRSNLSYKPASISNPVALIDGRPAHWAKSAQLNSASVARKPAATPSTAKSGAYNRSVSGSSSAFVRPSNSQVNDNRIRNNNKSSSVGNNVSFKPLWLQKSKVHSTQDNTRSQHTEEVIEDFDRAESNAFGSSRTRVSWPRDENYGDSGESSVAPTNSIGLGVRSISASSLPSKVASFRTISDENEDDNTTDFQGRAVSPVINKSPTHNMSYHSGTSYNSKVALMSSPATKKPTQGGLREKLLKLKRNLSIDITKLQVSHNSLISSFDLSDPRNRAEYSIKIKVGDYISNRLIDALKVQKFDINSLNFDSSLIYVPAEVQEANYKTSYLSTSGSTGTNLAIDMGFGEPSNICSDYIETIDSNANRNGAKSDPLPLFKKFEAGDEILACFREGDLQLLGLCDYTQHLRSVADRLKATLNHQAGGNDGRNGSTMGRQSNSFSTWTLYRPIRLTIDQQDRSSCDNSGFNGSRVCSIALSSFFEAARNN